MPKLKARIKTEIISPHVLFDIREKNKTKARKITPAKMEKYILIKKKERTSTPNKKPKQTV
jgi:hypothetical protein